MKNVENRENVNISDILDSVELKITERKSGVFTDREANYLSKKYPFLAVSEYVKPKKKRKVSKKSVKKTRTTKKKNEKK